MNRRAGVWLLAVMVFATACGSNATQRPAATAEPEPSNEPVATIASQTATVTIDWADSGVRWPDRFMLKFGDTKTEPGLRSEPGNILYPQSVAATQDGGFVLVDPAKQRLLSVDASGKYVGDWNGVSQAATDVVWDPKDDRLVWLDNSNQGQLGEILVATGSRNVVSVHRPIWSLVTTPWGVYARTSGSKLLPSPLTDLLAAFGDPSVQLPDGSAIDISKSAENVVNVARRGRWSLKLSFIGSAKGPPAPVPDLNSDLLIDGDSLVIATPIGSTSDQPFDMKLLVMEIGLSGGELRRSEQLDACGVDAPYPLTSRVIVNFSTGELSQLCVTERGVAVRRGWNVT